MLKIIPLPVFVRPLDGAPFVFDSETRLIAAHPDLVPLAEQFAAEVAAQFGIRLILTVDEDVSVPAVRLDLVESDTALDSLPPTGGKRADVSVPTDERHGLDIRSDGIRIRSTSPEGVYRGLTTLRQLIAAASTANTIPAAAILDAPRFGWRGLSLDVCRTFFTVDEVKQVIDLLALYKFNVLHLHLTDSEGWRIEIAKWPRLTEIGSQGAAYGRPGGFYTQEQFRDLVRYAAERFITIVPEIEMPGHTAAIFRSYPELVGDGSQPAAAGSPDTPGMLQFLHPDNPKVFPFLTDVLTELAALTPGSYLHIGGDEAFGMPDDLYARFVAQVRPIVYALGKKIVTWQEAARAGLGADDIAQYWIQFDPAMLESVDLNALPDDIRMPDGSKITPEVIQAIIETMSKSDGDVPKALATGADILMSLSPKHYLDTPYAELSSDPAQQADLARLGMKFYPQSTVEGFFDWDPATVRGDLGEDRLAGVEAAIWCESVTGFDDLCFLLLPRLPGIGEKGWSAAGNDNWSSYRDRLAAQAPTWRHQGWKFFKSSVVDWVE
jgi:hexosaminidase